MLSVNKTKCKLLIAASCLGLAACDGELADALNMDDNDQTVFTRSAVSVTWTEGEYRPYQLFENMCANPDGNQQSGSEMHEKMWLRSWTNDLYLWYDEVADVDPSGLSVTDYFATQKTQQTTNSGRDKDQFHFYYETSEWELLQVGVVSGYGTQWVFESIDDELVITVSLVEPGSPADVAGVKRGDTLSVIDGVDVATARQSQETVDVVNAGLFPSAHNVTHDFTLVTVDGETRDVSLISQAVETSAVFTSEIIATDTGNVGYIAFNNHNLVAQDALIATISDFIEGDVVDLVLDLRYNGGGFLALASQLSFMIAGQEATDSKVFENIVFNDKHTEVNPFTGNTLAPMGFIQTSVSFLGETPANTALSSLNLPRVFVLTTSRTCSASESIINSLRGIDIEVVQIGGTTCGKPYGFYATANCDNTYFSINMKGENDKGFGDFADGFSPENTPESQLIGVRLPGCFAEDDLTRQLGDPEEGMLAKALRYRETGDCGVDIAKASVQQKHEKLRTAEQLQGLKTLHPIHQAKIYNR